MLKRPLSVLFLLSTLAIGGCVQNIHKAQHVSMKPETFTQPDTNVLVLPIDVSVYEMGVNKIEEVPEWSEKGTQLVKSRLLDHLKLNDNLNIHMLPELQEEEQKIVEDHLELYMPVISSESLQQRSPAWKHKHGRPDTTLGPGLGFLKERYGADLAIMVVGEDYVSTGGRKAAFVLGALAGVAIPMGISVAHVGVVDLSSGNVLWSNISASPDTGLMTDRQVALVMNKIFTDFPGLEGVAPSVPEEVATAVKNDPHAGDDVDDINKGKKTSVESVKPLSKYQSEKFVGEKADHGSHNDDCSTC